MSEERPDFRAQFRDTPSMETLRNVSASCGEHPSLPKRHRWSKVREFGTFRDRMCLTCALTKSVDEKGRDL